MVDTRVCIIWKYLIIFYYPSLSRTHTLSPSPPALSSLLPLPPKYLDYSAYQQQQPANPYAAYSYGTQVASQPQPSIATAVTSYQTSYPTASTTYGVTVATATPSLVYGQTAVTSYSGYAPTSTGVNYSTGTVSSQPSYSTTTKPDVTYAAYQDPNAATRTTADAAQATYGAQPPPPPQPPSGATVQPPLNQVKKKL